MVDKNLISKIKISIDIGGTLSKLALLLSKNECLKDNDLLSLLNPISYKMISEFSSTANFNNDSEKAPYYVRNAKIDSLDESKLNPDYDGLLLLNEYYSHLVVSELFPFLEKLKEKTNVSELYLTGGGSVKFSDMLKANFSLHKFDEITSLIKGLFMTQKQSLYYLENHTLKELLINIKQDDYEIMSLNNRQIPFSKNLKLPYLVVNIGSGVSIVKVNSVTSFERIGGTMCGGGTLIGLAKLLIGTDNFHEILDLAKKGDHRKLDLLVSDIYGRKMSDKDEDNLLEKDVLASSFGKVYQILNNDSNHIFLKEDIAQSLLILICFQIAQLGYLYSKLNGIEEIVYLGTFSKSGEYSIDLLDYGTRFWNSNIKCYFSNNGGFLGSIGNLYQFN